MERRTTAIENLTEKYYLNLVKDKYAYLCYNQSFGSLSIIHQNNLKFCFNSYILVLQNESKHIILTVFTYDKTRLVSSLRKEEVVRGFELLMNSNDFK